MEINGARTWFASATPVSPAPHVISQQSGTVAAYEVGEIGTNEYIDYGVITSTGSISGGSTFMFLAQGTQYTLLEKYSPQVFEQQTTGGPKVLLGTLGPQTTINNTMTFPELNPGSLTANGLSFGNASQYYFGQGPFLPVALQTGHDASTSETLTPYASTSYGELYLVAHAGSYSGPDLHYVGYELQSYDFVPQFFLPTPLLTSVPASTITFTSGAKATALYGNGGTGCSSSNYFDLALTSASSYELTQAATTSNGTLLYTASTSSGARPAFDNYLYTAVAAAQAGVSQTTFDNSHPVLFVKENTGDYAALFNTNYIAPGGCGKPVIYLYPTKTTTVHVSVAADVTTSDPAYNGGWTVTASPWGKLTDNGSTYSSLYWEGYGVNGFPPITEGTVVSRAQVQQLLSSQAHALGLNATEDSAFVAFWSAKIPATPYVEVSWLTTAPLSRVLPLTVTPAPTTVIRVFVVMHGETTDVAVPPEILPAPPQRRGFTLVEWGGLLPGPAPHSS